MSETRWTAGPWSCVRKHPHVWAIDAPGGDIDLGHVKWHSLADVYGCDDMEEVGSEKARANAHLIAATPELYDALEMMLQMVEFGGFGKDAAMDTARAALAKARGEHP